MICKGIYNVYEHHLMLKQPTKYGKIAGQYRTAGGLGQYAEPNTKCRECGEIASAHKLSFNRFYVNDSLWEQRQKNRKFSGSRYSV